MLKTPVLFLIFNRPDTTLLVFEEIRKVKPKQLFIAADGPRKNKEGEFEKCEHTRQIATNIDWECELKILFRDQNLGCGRAVSEAITWFFENVAEGIILEDDCLPNASFFHFCETMLMKYRDNEKIMHIGGTNFQRGIQKGKDSYYFSKYIHIWGWATWRRAWQLYDFNMEKLPSSQFANLIKRQFPNRIEREFWINSFKNISIHSIDTWDTQWVFSIFINSGIGITPNINFVSNIGFDENATHTFTFDSKSANISTKTISEIIDPINICINNKADRYSFKYLYQNGDTYRRRIVIKIYTAVPSLKILVSRFKKYIKNR